MATGEVAVGVIADELVFWALGTLVAWHINSCYRVDTLHTLRVTMAATGADMHLEPVCHASLCGSMATLPCNTTFLSAAVPQSSYRLKGVNASRTWFSGIPIATCRYILLDIATCQTWRAAAQNIRDMKWVDHDFPRLQKSNCISSTGSALPTCSSSSRCSIEATRRMYAKYLTVVIPSRAGKKRTTLNSWFVVRSALWWQMI